MDWLFEPCDPEQEKDPQGQPWQHAVRGVRPGGRVTGYGHTEPWAEMDAKHKAEQYDAREILRLPQPGTVAIGRWNGKEWV